ncbi:MAG: NADH-quinone oxidoreductase subunit J family protein [Acidimicrobiales bacterium]
MIAALTSLPVLAAEAAALTDTEQWVINGFFGLIAIVMIGAALKLVTTENVVHAALYLLIVLAGVAAQYVILGAEFAAATQIMVYIGAILVLLLFGVMLTRAKLGPDPDLDHDQKWIAGLVAAILGAVMGYSLWEAFSDIEIPHAAQPQTTTQVADSIFSTYIVPFEAVSVLLLAALIGAVVVARRD